MSDKHCKQAISGKKEEEIIMKQVLGGLEEIATMLSYDPWPGDFEIIAVYSPDEEHDLPREEQVIVKSPAPESTRHKAEIISYQQHKERLLKSA